MHARRLYADKRHAERSPSRRSCREDAERHTRAFLDAIGVEFDYPRGRWDRDTRPDEGDPGIASWWVDGRGHNAARTAAVWDDGTIVEFANVPEFHFPESNPRDRLMNIRLLVQGVGWFSLISLTDRWDNLNADVKAEIDALPERESPKIEDEEGIVILGVSIQVSQDYKKGRKRHGKAVVAPDDQREA